MNSWKYMGAAPTCRNDKAVKMVWASIRSWQLALEPRLDLFNQGHKALFHIGCSIGIRDLPSIVVVISICPLSILRRKQVC